MLSFMRPDIADYFPYIQNVFDGRLDYAVFDLPLNSHNIFVQGFFHLLSLPTRRFDTGSILKLFSFPPFLEKFGMSPKKRSTISGSLGRAGRHLVGSRRRAAQRLS